jgi:putative phosphoribosyl transferase
MHFVNRHDAGHRLAALLGDHRTPSTIVMALPRGGVPVGYEIASAIDAPLDVLVARKLGAPGHPELAIGAVAPGAMVLDSGLIEELGVPKAYVDDVLQRERRKMRQATELFRGPRRHTDVTGKTVVLVDDGIATGATMLVAMDSLHRRGATTIVAAAPVCAAEAFDDLQQRADAVTCVLVPDTFQAVGAWYVDFTQTSDEEVLTLLERAELERNARGHDTLASV